MHKIKIDDLSKLKITKVTTWKIYFDYDGVHYMIIDDSDEDSHISFYKRDIDNGKVRLTLVNQKITCMSVGRFIKDISRKHPKHLVYSNVDREYFVKQLVKIGFSCGMFENEYYNKEKEIQKIRNEISLLSDKIHDIDKEWEKTSGHGSKCYGLKLKAEKAERIDGAKDGEWCEQYKDYYGNTHPKYGGTLTDLFSLPVGTSFYVCNGCYDAMITVDEHGDKCIVTCCSCVKLTKENHSLYIK